MPTPKQQRRRALELLEASIDGCTEAIMPARSRSSSCSSLIRSGRASFRVWRVLAAMLPALPSSSTRCLESRWNCSKRLRPQSRVSVSSSSPTQREGCAAQGRGKLGLQITRGRGDRQEATHLSRLLTCDRRSGRVPGLPLPFRAYVRRAPRPRRASNPSRRADLR